MEVEHTTNILVTNIDPKVTVEALTTFFSFTGNVTSVRLSDAPNGTKTAIVSFDNEESVKTAELMSGATLESNRIEIQPTTLIQQTEHDDVYSGETLPQRTIPELPEQHTKTSVAASLLARGYILASDTFQKAVEFDKQHSITSTIKAGAHKVKETAIAVDEKLHFTEYLALGAAYVSSMITAVDEKYEVSKTVSNAINTASQKVDETLHITQGVEIAKQTIQNGVDYVKNSQPVVAIRNTTNNFKEDVKNEIQSRRPVSEEKESKEMMENIEINESYENDPFDGSNVNYTNETYQMNQQNQTAVTVVVRRAEFDKYCNIEDYINNKFITFDYPVWLSILAHNKVHYLPECTAVYREIGTSISNTSNLDKRLNFERETYKIRRYIIDKYGSAGLSAGKIRLREAIVLSRIAWRARNPFKATYLFFSHLIRL